MFKSAFFSSAANVLAPLLIAVLTGVENVAVWLGTRAGIQLAVVAAPSPIHALLQSHGGSTEAVDSDTLRQRTPVYIFLLATLTFALVFLVARSSLFPINSQDMALLPFALAAFAALMFLTAASMGILRVLERGDIFLAVAKRELVLSIAILPVLYAGFSWFVLAAAAKELTKLQLLMRAFGRPHLRLPHWRDLRSGSGQYWRGITQAASQYMERTVYPLIFPIKVAGQLGLGSTIGILPVILSSNMYMWAFKGVAEGDERARSSVVCEWARLLTLAASLTWWLAAANSVVDLGHYGAVEVAAAASFTAIMGVGFLALARSRVALLGVTSSLLHIGATAAVYVAVAAAANAGAGVLLALLAGLYVNGLYTVLLAARMQAREAAMLLWHCAAALAAITFFAVTAPVRWGPGTLVAVTIASFLSAPYLRALWKSRRR